MATYSIITFEKYPISFSMTDNEKYIFEDLIFTELKKQKKIDLFLFNNKYTTILKL